MSYSSVYTRLPSATVSLNSGPIVTCLTFASIRITTSPPRCNIPKIGGFSLANVPRPRPPFKPLRRGASLFFDGLGMSLMSGHHIDFVAFDLALQGTFSRRMSYFGQLFPQLLRGQLEELPEAQLGHLQT